MAKKIGSMLGLTSRRRYLNDVGRYEYVLSEEMTSVRRPAKTKGY